VSADGPMSAPSYGDAAAAPPAGAAWHFFMMRNYERNSIAFY
jgi:hypothetical protein